MNRTFGLALFCSLVFLSPISHGAEKQIVLGISEGTSGTIDAVDANLKYAPLAELLSSVLKKKVIILLARDFSMLEKSLSQQKYDFLLARPSDYPARAIRDYGYRYVATAKPEGQCVFISKDGSPYKKIEDIKGKRIGLSEKESYMSRFCAAELRDHGIDVNKEKVHYSRQQEGLVFAAKNGLVDVVGVASYSRAFLEWEKAGLPVLHRSRPEPYLPLIASQKISAQDIHEIQASLKRMSDSADSKKALRRIGVESFESDTQARLDGLLVWLGK